MGKPFHGPDRHHSGLGGESLHAELSKPFTGRRTYAGIIVLSAWLYEMLRRSQMAAYGFGDEEAERKSAVIGALSLYLDLSTSS